MKEFEKLIGNVLGEKAHPWYKTYDADDRMGKFLSGGLSAGKGPEDFDPKQLVAGTRVEQEHTDDKEIAQKIAMDHLSEDPEYYVKLKKMEQESIEEAKPKYIRKPKGYLEPDIRSCLWCGNPFRSEGPWQRFCSRKSCVTSRIQHNRDETSEGDPEDYAWMPKVGKVSGELSKKDIPQETKR